MENNSKNKIKQNTKSIVYLTVNTVNNKIYVGVHDTSNPEIFDNYYGDGIIKYKNISGLKHPKTPFQKAMKKYGFDAFRRFTIKVCDTREEALKLEAFIVDDEFIKRSDTYNICLGGGNPPVAKKEVFQYDLNGNFLQRFESADLAGISIGHVSGSSILFALYHKTMAGGYYWTDYKINKIDVSLFITKPQIKEVYEYDGHGNFVKKYDSLAEVTRKKQVDLGPLQRAIKTTTKVKGSYFSFEYVEKFYKKITTRHYGDPVFQYSMSGEYMRAWNNISEIVKTLGKTFRNIPQAIATKSSCGGYQWSWEHLNSLSNKKKPISKARKVGQYTLDGKLIKTFNTVRECRKEFGNVSRVLKGLVKQCKGYTFKYIES